MEQEYPDNTIENREKAIADGFEVIDGCDACLLLDLDTDAAIDRYRKMLPYVNDSFSLSKAKPEEWKSKSGKGLHVRIWLDKGAPIHERIALQTILGSDPFREFLALRDTRENRDYPIMLFKPPFVVADEKAEQDRKDRELVEIFGVTAV